MEIFVYGPLWIVVVIVLSIIAALTRTRAATWFLVAAILVPVALFLIAGMTKEMDQRDVKQSWERNAAAFESFCTSKAQRLVVHEVQQSKLPVLISVWRGASTVAQPQVAFALSLEHLLRGKLVCPARSIVIEATIGTFPPSGSPDETPKPQYVLCGSAAPKPAGKSTPLSYQLVFSEDAVTDTEPDRWGKVRMVKTSVRLLKAGKVVAEDAVFSTMPEGANMVPRCPLPQQRLAEFLIAAFAL